MAILNFYVIILIFCSEFINLICNFRFYFVSVWKMFFIYFSLIFSKLSVCWTPQHQVSHMAMPCMFLIHLFFFYLWYLAFCSYGSLSSYACCSLTMFAFCILELCCLDSMFFVLFTVFEFCIPHSGHINMLPAFYVRCSWP